MPKASKPGERNIEQVSMLTCKKYLASKAKMKQQKMFTISLNPSKSSLTNSTRQLSIKKDTMKIGNSISENYRQEIAPSLKIADHLLSSSMLILSVTT